MTNIQVGKRVAYSVQFLKSIGMSHSYMAHAKGVVQSIKSLGNIQLAYIKWDDIYDEEVPCYVNVKNLAIRRQIEQAGLTVAPSGL